jgi:hypothetical protein
VHTGVGGRLTGEVVVMGPGANVPEAVA